jgi:hypothetical protein
MAPLDDPDVRLPAVLRDPPVSSHGEPVGMERPAEDLERQVGDPRTPKAHSHAPAPFLRMACISCCSGRTITGSIL